MPISEWRNPGVRTLVAVAVVATHVYVLVALLAHRMPIAAIPWDESDLFELVDTYDEEPPPPSISLEVAAVRPAATIELQQPEIDAPALADQTSPDWLTAAELAAANVSVADGIDLREFGLVPRPGARPRKAKAFGWDKTHTQRVETLPEGGIRIRLSARCEMTLAPFPMAGCSLGKIPARGDLFAEMSSPVAPGDWRDSAATLNGR